MAAHDRFLSCPLSHLRERVGVRVDGLITNGSISNAACPHPCPLPQAGEGERN